MNIQFNTDKNIAGHEKHAALYKNTISDAFARFNDYITSVEIHLSDENGGKTGPKDKKCVLEIRVKNLKPIAVTEREDSMDQAVKGAIIKGKAALDTVLGKLSEH
jgi:hypothetical protein